MNTLDVIGVPGFIALCAVISILAYIAVKFTDPDEIKPQKPYNLDDPIDFLKFLVDSWLMITVYIPLFYAGCKYYELEERIKKIKDKT